MLPHPHPVETIFHALGHGTRRAVVARLGLGPATVSELAAPFDLSLPTFCQHLAVLEAAGLVRSHKRGRVRTCELVPDVLATAESWLHAQRHLWERRLDQLDHHLLHVMEDE